MTITEIRKAIPHKRDRQYERDVFERLVKSSISEGGNGKIVVKNYLLLGCAVDRLEISGTHIALGFIRMDHFLKATGIGNVLSQVWFATSLYRLLVERKFRAEEIGELNEKIDGYRWKVRFLTNLIAHLRTVKTKEECQRLIEAHFSPVKKRRLSTRIKRKYAYGAHLVEFRTADLLQNVENYLKSISPLQPNGAEIIKALAVKTLVEKPTEKKAVSWCREFGLPPIFSALFLGAISRDVNLHCLSFDKLMANWNTDMDLLPFRKNRWKKDTTKRSMLERTIEFFGAEECEE